MGDSTDLDVAGGGLKAISQIGAGDTREQIEKDNATIADQQAKSEMTAAGYNADLMRKKGSMIMGQQVSAQGANNLQQRGTTSLVVADTARANEANVLQVQNNAMRRAWGFQVQGASDTFQAEQAERGGILSGIGSVVGAAGAVAKDQYNE